MEKDKKEICWCIASKMVILILALGGISCCLFVLDEQASTLLCKIFVLLLFVVCSVLAGCGMSCHKRINKIADDAITEEKIKSWVKESVTKTIDIKADESLASKLEAINRNIITLNESLHEELQDVLLTKNTNLKFIQEMARSIGMEGKAWDKEQVERFMICLNAITGMQNEDAKHSDVDSSKVELSPNENDDTSDSLENVK